MRYLKSISIVLLLCIPLLVSSCGDTNSTGEVTHTYSINDLFMTSVETGKTTVYVRIDRDDEPLISAIVTADTTNVVTSNGDGTWMKEFAVDTFGDTVQFDIRTVPADFSYRDLVVLPDTFSFQVSGLTGGVVRSSTPPVKLTWTRSSAEDGYMIIVAPVNPANPAEGYSNVLAPDEYVVENPYLIGAIPKSAYLSSQGAFQAGDYNVWIVAFSGSPFDFDGLPFDLPQGFPNNISRIGVTGKSGALFIAQKTILTAAEL